MTGERIAGRYELTHLISTGGMGQVWRGYDTRLDRDVAVKLIRPATELDSDAELAGRFRREVRVTARIEHPGVPPVYDAGLDPAAGLYMVMRLVRGVSLADALAEEGALPIDWVASIAAQICSVLSYAHAVPVVHRDLKPGNVMIAEDGTVRVLDFGVAAVLKSDITKLTVTGSMVGTKPYMSPEQILNDPISPRTDLYALGCLLHEMLCGQRVFSGDEVALMYQHLEAAPTPVRDLRPGVSADLERLVLDLLAKSPEDRPDDARTVHARLVPFLPPRDAASPDHAAPPGAVPDPTRPFRYPMAPRPRQDPRVAPEPADLGEPVTRDAARNLQERAVELIGEGRFSLAEEALNEIIPGAVHAFGADDRDVLELRRAHAVSLFLGGDYRRALPEFDALAEAFGRVQGERGLDALECRGQAAYCRMELGDTTDALDELAEVVAGYRALGMSTDGDVLVMRLRVVWLLAAAGRFTEAEDALPTLDEDVRATLGPDDQLTRDVRDLGARLTARRRHGPPS